MSMMQPAPSAQVPVRRCTMPNCGQPMQGRRVPGSARLGTVDVIAYRCLMCDVRKCKCGHLVQSLTARLCPACGRDLYASQKD